MPKTGNKTGEKGGQRKNDNAVTHAGYSRYIDKRTKDGKWIQTTALNWISDLGGIENLSSMQISILDDLAIIAWRCRRLGRVIVERNETVSESITKDFLRFHNALVDGLSKLGLERRARDVQTLQEYIQQNYANNSEVIITNGVVPTATDKTNTVDTDTIKSEETFLETGDRSDK